MILTITLNPAVDISYKLETFSLDTVNRVADVSKTAGGKGLNVARVLRQLGEEVAASGFLGGSLGGFIRSQIGLLGIADFFVEIEDETRNCIAVIHEGKQTEILESGPVISEKESLIIFRGSLNMCNKSILSRYLEVCQRDWRLTFIKMVGIASQYNTRVLLDSNGALLTSIVRGEHKPYLIKPNEDELADLLGYKLLDE